METVTDYVAAGSFADIADHVQYKNSPDYAQLIRTVDLKHEFRNSDYVYVDKKAFDYLWRVNLNEECIVLPNIGANIGEVYYIAPLSLPYEFNVLGPNAILLKTKDSTKFMFTLLQADDFQNKLYVSIASSGQPKFNKTELKSIKILMPQPDEQEKIGAFFSKLDTLITLHQRECFSFDFSGESAKTAQKTISWEQRELKELASFAKGSGYSKTDIKEQGTPLILYGRLYTKYETKIDEVDTFAEPKKGSVYSKGTEVVVPASGESAEDIARASFVAKSGILLGGDLNIIYPNGMIEPTFLALSISNGEQQKNLAKKAQGKSVVHLHNSDLETVNITYPTIAEQTKIGRYFLDLDHLITLHQHKPNKKGHDVLSVMPFKGNQRKPHYLCT